MAETETLICPKCRATMRSYERSGVVADQCEVCRGIFLDRGELERLIDMEGTYEPRRGERRDSDDGRDLHEDDAPKKRKSRTSLIADLFGGD